MSEKTSYDMRPDVAKQLKEINKTIDLDGLMRELVKEQLEAVKVMVKEIKALPNFMEMMERQLFEKKEGSEFVPRLSLVVDAEHDEESVKKARSKIKYYSEVINAAISRLDDLLDTIRARENAGYTLAGNNSPVEIHHQNENLDLDEIETKVSQAIGLLQSYLDLFKEWEEAPAHITAEAARQKISQILERLNTEVLIGQEQVTRLAIMTILAGGHILLVGPPGLGKTKLAKALAAFFGMKYSRIQGNEDLTPTDVAGDNVRERGHDGTVRVIFQPGPLFKGQVVFVDEAGRMRPNAFDPLLEAMEERTVTISSVTHKLPSNFMVIATLNPDPNNSPVDITGMAPAFLDRFVSCAVVNPPTLEDLVRILAKPQSPTQPTIAGIMNPKELAAVKDMVNSVETPTSVVRYVASIITNTQPSKSTIESVKKYIEYYINVRAAERILALAKAQAFLEGRSVAAIDDVVAVVPAALIHRLSLNKSKGIVKSLTADGGPQGVIGQVINDILNYTTRPSVV